MSYWYTSFEAIAVGPSGPPSLLTVGPYSAPSTVLKISAAKPVSAENFQWVQLGLPVPAGTLIAGVQLGYRVIAPAGGTSIVQVRLTQTDLPNAALVVLDDAVNLTSPAPTHYTTPPTKITVAGAITLELRIAIAHPNDVILLGGVQLLAG